MEDKHSYSSQPSPVDAGVAKGRQPQNEALGSGSESSDRTLAFLYNLALADLTSGNREAAMQNIVDLISAHLNADHTYILLKDENSDELQKVASACRHAEHISKAAASTLGMRDEHFNTASSGLINHGLEKGQGILVRDTMNNEEFGADPDFQRFNIKAAICVPIKAMSAPVGRQGLIYLDSSQDNCKWSKQELDLLNFIAGCLGPAIEVINLQQEKERDQRLIAAGKVVLNISHSVKNILQLISGAVEVLDFGLRTDQIHRVKRSWKILKPNLDRIGRFTLDMLDFSKEKRLELSGCEFNRIIQAAVESLQMDLKQKETNLHIRIDQKIPVIELDCDGIHQMAVNLILNAIDIVDENTGVVTVETKFCADEGAVELAVSDNGPSLNDEEKEEIFLPLQSIRNKTGSGLGLAIAKKIVEQHRGRIEIESAPERGSTLRVIIPAKVVPQT